jgi:ectoine hydroxylase-related dioxygenase (phytanoyl-CoA dioxygenase family)
VFEDPRPGARILEPQYAEMTAFNSNRFVVAAEKGRMIMWPSYLLHAVDAGKSTTDDDRIVIAFNIMIRTTIETMTARLELK